MENTAMRASESGWRAGAGYRYSSTLSRDAQADLTWFFSEGQVVFERSPMGLMLKKAENSTFGSKVCSACDGVGYEEAPEAAIRKAIEAGREWEQLHGSNVAAAIREHQRVHGCAPSWFEDGTCRSCSGSGWTPRKQRGKSRGAVTVWPTGSSLNRQSATEIDGDTVERYGRVVRRLARLPRVERRTAEQFFGLAGGLLLEAGRGRIWAVMADTTAARKLIRMGRGKTKAGPRRSPIETLSVEAELQLSQPNETRGTLLAMAFAQARERVLDLEHHWTTGAVRAPDRVVYLQTRIARLERHLESVS